MSLLDEQKHQGDVVLGWNSSALNAENSNELRNRLNACKVNPPNSLTLNLEQVQYMDSSGMGTLLLGKRILKESDTPFFIRKPSKAVRQLLKLAQIENLFEFTS